MPAYRTHVAVNLVVGLPLTLAALKYSVKLSPQELFAFVGAFTYGTFFLHPDLDIAHKIKLFSLKGFFTLPFRPYSWLFRHRGISHVPVLGTLTRVLWIAGLCWLCAIPVLSTPLIWFMIAGLAVSDLFHILLDQVA